MKRVEHVISQYMTTDRTVATLHGTLKLLVIVLVDQNENFCRLRTIINPTNMD